MTPQECVESDLKLEEAQTDKEAIVKTQTEVLATYSAHIGVGTLTDLKGIIKLSAM